LYSDVIFKLVPNWDKWINVLGDYVEKQWYLNGITELHLTL
jgi:hypothetical protein